MLSEKLFCMGNMKASRRVWKCSYRRMGEDLNFLPWATTRATVNNLSKDYFLEQNCACRVSFLKGGKGHGWAHTFLAADMLMRPFPLKWAKYYYHLWTSHWFLMHLLNFKKCLRNQLKINFRFNICVPTNNQHLYLFNLTNTMSNFFKRVSILITKQW